MLPTLSKKDSPMDTRFYLQHGSSVPQQSLKEKMKINQLMELKASMIQPAENEDSDKVETINPNLVLTPLKSDVKVKSPRKVDTKKKTQNKSESENLNIDKITPEQAA